MHMLLLGKRQQVNFLSDVSDYYGVNNGASDLSHRLVDAVPKLRKSCVRGTIHVEAGFLDRQAADRRRIRAASLDFARQPATQKPLSFT